MTGDTDTPDWLKRLLETRPDLEKQLQRPFAERSVSAEQHSRKRRLDLGARVLKQTRIYLDQKYWIYCRDAMVGRPQRAAHADIWSLLQQLTICGRVVCPASFPILLETFKQSDMTTRRQTAAVIDTLCQGVAVQPTDILIKTELYHLWMSQTKGTADIHPLAQMVWNFAGWVGGESLVRMDFLDGPSNDLVQRELFDILAAVPFSSIIEATAGQTPPPLFDDAAHYYWLNAETARFQTEVTSFDSVFESEVAGILDVLRPEVSELLCHRFAIETGGPAPLADSPEAIADSRLFENFIFHAYRRKRWTTEFPYLHILAGIHAATRHRRQPFKCGDHWDHNHAHAALPYCNAFLTERSLGNLLTARPLEYDRAYGCRVLWNEESVLAYLRAL